MMPITPDPDTQHWLRFLLIRNLLCFVVRIDNFFSYLTFLSLHFKESVRHGLKTYALTSFEKLYRQRG
jgi:hypothetical protein